MFSSYNCRKTDVLGSGGMMPMLSTGMILSAMLETIEMSCVFLSKVFLVLVVINLFFLVCKSLIPITYDISSLVCDLYEVNLRFETQIWKPWVQTWKWKTWKWEAEFQVYLKKYSSCHISVFTHDKHRIIIYITNPVWLLTYSLYTSLAQNKLGCDVSFFPSSLAQ